MCGMFKYTKLCIVVSNIWAFGMKRNPSIKALSATTLNSVSGSLYKWGFISSSSGKILRHHLILGHSVIRTLSTVKSENMKFNQIIT